MMPHINYFLDRLEIKINRGDKAKSLYIKEIDKKIKSSQTNDPELANKLWIIKNIYLAQNKYLNSFLLLKRKEYYKAWCELEDCEITLLYLLKNYTIDTEDKYKIKFIEQMVDNWQAVFPYRLFTSPEFLEKKIRCSICGEIRKPRSKCNHKTGLIYGGQLCLGIVEEMELVSLALVKNPVQKYSVMFSTNQETNEQEDHHDYTGVDFIIDRLESPLDAWSYIKTFKRHQREQLDDYPLDNPCPCQSTKNYAECCYLKGWVDVPHIQISFEKHPPKNMPTYIRGF